jgi:PKD repeat protein
MKLLMMVGVCVLLAIISAGCTTQPPITAPPSPTLTAATTPGMTPASPPPTETIVPQLTPSPTPLSIMPPIAQFTASPTAGKVPLTVSFTDTSTGSPTSWAWDFGDGSTSRSKNPVHTYTVPGTYTVRLLASNSGGSNSEAKLYDITVNPAYAPPGASFSANPPTMAQPYTVQFLDRSTGPPTSWSWSFGDGGASSMQDPVHTYPGPGMFIVTLEVSNPAGSSRTTGYVTIG